MSVNNMPDGNSTPLEERLASHMKQEYGEPRPASDLWQSIAPQLHAPSEAEAPRPSNGLHPSTRKAAMKMDQWMPLPSEAARKPRLPITLLPAAALVLLIAGSLVFWLWQSNPELPVVADSSTPRPTATVVAPTPVASSTEVAVGQVITTVMPSDWALEGSSLYEHGVDRIRNYGGNPVGYIKSDNLEAPDYGALRQFVSADSLLEKRVRFSANIKTEGVERRAGLWMEVLTSASSETQSDSMMDRPLQDTNDWHRYEIVLDVPSDATIIQFGAQLSGKGQVWVSDAKLEVVGEEVALTSSPPPYNKGFEEGLTRWGMGQGYSGGTQGVYDVSLSTEIVHSGTGSASIKGLTVETTNFQPLFQSLPAKPYTGKRVRFSAYVKAEGVEQWAGLWMRLDGETIMQTRRVSLALDNMSDRPIRGTSDWQRYEVVLDVPQEASRVVIGLLLTGKGQVWMDDVKLEEVGSDIQVTGYVTLDRPQNLLFEEGLTGWGMGDGTYEVVLDYANVHSGRTSAHLKPYNNEVAGSGYLYQNTKAEQYRGKRVRLSAYIKTDRLIYDATLTTFVVGELRGTDSHYVATAVPKSANGWNRYEVVVDVPQESSYISIGVNMQGGGELWLDDVQLEEVGLEVPTTAPPK